VLEKDWGKLILSLGEKWEPRTGLIDGPLASFMRGKRKGKELSPCERASTSLNGAGRLVRNFNVSWENPSLKGGVGGGKKKRGSTIGLRAGGF